jgi:hypothetical protein
MLKDLQGLFSELVKTIAEYESDTFSSEASEITQAEAEQVAFELVRRDIQARIDTDTMDGVDISEELEEIRA